MISRQDVPADGAFRVDFCPLVYASLVKDVQIGTGQLDDLFFFLKVLEADGALGAARYHLRVYLLNFGKVCLVWSFAAADVDEGEY